MKFLVDSQLPVALSRFLESKNLLAHHVVDIQLDEASDREI
jgi:predicted nuclease of predicted toxin-antitoxin system